MASPRRSTGSGNQRDRGAAQRGRGRRLIRLAVAAEGYGFRALWHSNYHAHWDPFVNLGGAVLSSIGTTIDYKKLRIVRGVREAVEILKSATTGQFSRGYKGEIFQVTRPHKMAWAKSRPPRA